MPLESLSQLVGPLPEVRIVDVGANPLYGAPPYQPLLDAKKAQVTGFEPEPEPFGALIERRGPNERYLPYVVGDGEEHGFWSLAHPGMSSIYEPDVALMSHFGPRQDYQLADEHFVERSRVRSRERVRTTRLDDVPDLGGVDYLKIDVQGGELKVFEGATNTLRDTLLIHTEALFLCTRGSPCLLTWIGIFPVRGFVSTACSTSRPGQCTPPATSTTSRSSRWVRGSSSGATSFFCATSRPLERQRRRSGSCSWL